MMKGLMHMFAKITLHEVCKHEVCNTFHVFPTERQRAKHLATERRVKIICHKMFVSFLRLCFQPLLVRSALRCCLPSMNADTSHDK